MILIVEDRLDAGEALAELFRHQGFEVRVAATIEQARAVISAQALDLVLLDLQLPDGSGMELLHLLEEQQPETEVVIVTGHGTIDSAVESVKGGAIDYLTKPIHIKHFDRIVERLRRTLRLREEVGSLRSELRRLGRFGPLVGNSSAMERLYDLISKVAPTSSSVLITGETGTGKDLVAQAIHQMSPRASKPLLPINCGAMPAELIESELFGHQRGAFTGAERDHRGVFERADGGTLFLDEITEMPLELQGKLLRVLESGEFCRVGGTRTVKTDVRIVAASNREAGAAAGEPRLRQDLHYRLDVFPIHTPPLRDHLEDLELLTHHFLAELNGPTGKKRFTPGALACLRQHTWPGNVRELKNVVERAFILGDDEIGPEALTGISVGVPATPAVRIDVGASLEDAERQLILATLRHLAGDKKQAADVLEISLKTLYNRLNQYRGSLPPSTHSALEASEL